MGAETARESSRAFLQNLGRLLRLCSEEVAELRGRAEDSQRFRACGSQTSWMTLRNG